MARACCPGCRLRFTAAAAAHLPACPVCGVSPLQPLLGPEAAIGFRLFVPHDAPQSPPAAQAVSLPVTELWS